MSMRLFCVRHFVISIELGSLPAAIAVMGL